MAESQLHLNLVKLLYSWAKENLDTHIFSQVAIDLPDSELKPPSIKNTVPDLFFSSKDLCIVGEAKTPWDFDRNHSLQQYEDILNYLNNKNSIFLLACNYSFYKPFRSLIRDIILTNDIRLAKDPIFLKIDDFK